MSGQAKDPYHFPFKLYAMLEYASSEDSEHGPPAVAWTENGQAFAIRDREAFLKRDVPKFFKQTKFRSFVSSFLSPLSCLTSRSTSSELTLIFCSFLIQ